MCTRALRPPVHVIQPSDPNAAHCILKFDPSQLAPENGAARDRSRADTVRGARSTPPY
jgi:hypothetical protein